MAPHNGPQKRMVDTNVYTMQSIINGKGLRETAPAGRGTLQREFRVPISYNHARLSITLSHSSWIILSKQNLFLSNEFPLYQQAHATFRFSCMQRKGHCITDPKPLS